MLFDLLALQAVVESRSASGYRRGLWQLAGGFSLALAALSKQNYGLFFIPIVFAMLRISAIRCWPATCTIYEVCSVGRLLSEGTTSDARSPLRRPF